MAIAHGDSATKRTGLRQTCSAVNTHLIRSQGQTRIVILITDVWAEKHFQDSIDAFRAHRDNGVIFLPFLATNWLAYASLDL